MTISGLTVPSDVAGWLRTMLAQSGGATATPTTAAAGTPAAPPPPPATGSTFDPATFWQLSHNGVPGDAAAYLATNPKPPPGSPNSPFQTQQQYQQATGGGQGTGTGGSATGVSPLPYDPLYSSTATALDPLYLAPTPKTGVKGGYYGLASGGRIGLDTGGSPGTSAAQGQTRSGQSIGQQLGIGNQYGYMDIPGWGRVLMRLAGLLPGLPGLLATGANAAKNYNNLDAVNTERVAAGLPSLDFGQMLGGMLGFNSYPSGEIANKNVGQGVGIGYGNTASESWGGGVYGGNTTVTPAERVARENAALNYGNVAPTTAVNVYGNPVTPNVALAPNQVIDYTGYTSGSAPGEHMTGAQAYSGMAAPGSFGNIGGTTANNPDYSGVVGSPQSAGTFGMDVAGEAKSQNTAGAGGGGGGGGGSADAGGGGDDSSGHGGAEGPGSHHAYGGLTSYAMGGRGFEGHVMSPTPGRADMIPANLSGGEYVLPADVVSAHGQGNTNAGADALDRHVKQVRAHVIARLKKMPGPRR